MYLEWGKNLHGSNPMELPRASWIKCWYPLNGWINGLEVPNSLWL